MEPTFATPHAFFGRAERSREAAVCVAGVPYDIGTSNRPGARFGPHAIRHASRMLLDGDHPGSWVDPSKMSLADIGDFRIALGDVQASMRLIERQATGIAHLIALGGDHSVTLPLLRALARRFGPIGLIHFDAHVDTWPDSFGQTYGHGSPFFHAINEKLIDPRRTVQIGIRSPVQRKIHDWTTGKGVTILSALKVHEEGTAAVAARVSEVVGAGPTYLTFDIDSLDPAFAPGTGTPEIGGLASWQMQSILRKLGDVDFVGMDVVEVAPAYDVAEVTALAAATVSLDYAEGVYGLVRAVRTAGARNVLVTLWPLNDGETRDSMLAFYRTWLAQAGHSDPARALRETRLSYQTTPTATARPESVGIAAHTSSGKPAAAVADTILRSMKAAGLAIRRRR